ncbi:MAG TPA: outer membrane beta-barrel protein [Terriglobia bacterium]|nr:outer membrane beta-barrel protein [Terriglobia bacterium]
MIKSNRGVSSPHLRRAQTEIAFARLRIAAMLSFAIFIGGPRQASGQEVSGIYTDSAPKDLGDKTKIDWLKNIKFRGWVEGSYIWNFNKVNPDVANAHQVFSAIRDRNLTIEGQAFHTHDNSFTLDLAEIEVEKVPERGGVGFKVDIAAGDIQDTIVDTIKALSPNGVSDFDKTFQHASLSYLAPVGKGLRFDFGKFVTHIGGETIESIKNRNFSHAFFHTYAIPFQDSGIRMNYTFSPRAYAELYILNGWNVTFDNNRGKTYGLSFGLTPSGKLNATLNYLGGPEHNGNSGDWRHLGDFQVIYSPVATLQTMVNLDVGQDNKGIGRGKNALWRGATFYLRPTIKGRFSPTLRAEYYDDRDGFTTGVAQHLWEVTVTPDYKLGGQDDFAHVLLRPEFRYDKSTVPFFSHENSFRSRDHQWTVGIGLVAYF